MRGEAASEERATGGQRDGLGVDIDDGGVESFEVARSRVVVDAHEIAGTEIAEAR